MDAEGESVASFGIWSWELGETRQIVDVTPCLDRRRTNAANSETADRERVVLSLILENAGTGAAASDIGRLHFL